MRSFGPPFLGMLPAILFEPRNEDTRHLTKCTLSCSSVFLVRWIALFPMPVVNRHQEKLRYEMLCRRVRLESSDSQIL